MSDTVSLKIFDKLNGENFAVWKVRMRALLVSKGLWKVTEPSADAEVSAELSESDIGKSEQALALMVLAVEADQMIHIEECKTSREAWEKLIGIYAEPSAANRMRLYERLLTLRFPPGGNSRQHVQLFASTRTELRAVGISIDDTLYKIALLRSLSSSFEGLSIALEAQMDEISIDDLHARIYREEARQKAAAGSHAAALSTRSNDTRRPRFDKRKMKCYHCGKKGHLRSECRKRKQEEAAANDEKKEDSTAHAMMCRTSPQLRSCWYVDSGASFHICNNLKYYTSEVKSISPIQIQIGDGSMMTAKYSGDISAVFETAFGRFHVTLCDVLFIPQSSVNLISVAQVQCKGYSVQFQDDECRITQARTNSVALRLRRNGNGYHVRAVHIAGANAHVASSVEDMWHKRLGHIGQKAMQEGIRQESWKDGPREAKPTNTCIGCDRGKMKNRSFKAVSKSMRAKRVLDLVHTDVCGPFKTPSLGGSLYFLVMVDDFSRMTFVFFMKRKSEAETMIRNFVAYAERLTGRKLKSIRSDNGGEYCSVSIRNYFASTGIAHEMTAPYSPQQNGVAERTNRILLDKARAMLLDLEVPQFLWAEAVSTATYLRNRTPSEALGWKTPIELWNNKVPRIGHLRVFGCHVEAFVPKARRGKLDPRSKACIFIGYGSTWKNYRLYDVSAKRIIVSSAVKFYEGKSVVVSEAGRDKPTPLDVFDGLLNETVSLDVEASEGADTATTPQDSSVTQVGPSDHTADPQGTPPAEEQEGTSTNAPTLRRSTRTREPPLRLTYDHMLTDDEDEDVARMYVAHEPCSYKEAVRDSENGKWHAAMIEEMEGLAEHNTWTLVEKPECVQSVIDCRWVFKHKPATRATNARYKARLVAKGFQQRRGVDFMHTFAPVARISSIRLLLAHALCADIPVHQMDVKNAFLNGVLNEDVYMRQPEGFIDPDRPHHVCKLNRTLYGLKQAARGWYEELVRVLDACGLDPLQSDQSVFYGEINGEEVWLLAYVDDLLVLSRSPINVTMIKMELGKAFIIKDLGIASEFVGIAILYDEKSRRLKLSQTAAVKRAITKFGMDLCKPVSTPMERDVVDLLRSTSAPAINVPYREAIGSLLYFSTCTRPDISHSVGVLSQFCSNPLEVHWKMVKRIFRYLKGTADYGLVYSADGTQGFVGFCDADWAGLPCRKSTSGSVLFYNNCLVAWKSKKQSITALSTTEAELVALVDAYKEQKAVYKLFKEVKLVEGSWKLYCDNQGCIAIAKGTGYRGRAKHIDLRYFAIQEVLKNGEINLVYCPSSENFSDLMTKSLPRSLLNTFRSGLGVFQ